MLDAPTHVELIVDTRAALAAIEQVERKFNEAVARMKADLADVPSLVKVKVKEPSNA